MQIRHLPLLALALLCACDVKPADQHRRAMDPERATAPSQRATFDDPLDPERSLYLGTTRVRVLKTSQYTQGASWVIEMLVCKTHEGHDLVKLDYQILNDGDLPLPKLKLDWAVELDDGTRVGRSTRCPLMQENYFGSPLPAKGIKDRTLLFEIPEGRTVKHLLFHPDSASPAFFKPGPVHVLKG